MEIIPREIVDAALGIVVALEPGRPADFSTALLTRSDLRCHGSQGGSDEEAANRPFAG